MSLGIVTVQDQCRLCLQQCKLENSHIVPNFVMRWLKETSGTGFLRSGQTPNRRSQDGYKLYWLCPACEDLFAEWEMEFATKVFHPLTSGKASKFQYQEWLLKFAVSLSWRCLLYMREVSGLTHFSEALRREAERALTKWSEFLLGRQPHPGKYEQHLWPFDMIVDHTVQDMPPNINRYLLRSVEIDAVCSDRQAFVYVKLPSILLIGFIHITQPKEWEGTKVHVRQGLLGSSQYSFPKNVFEYMMGRARKAKEIQETISDNQKEKIKQSFTKNMDKLTESETFKAMHADVTLFGSESFKSRDS
jgi:hypothetical protein